MTELIAYYRVSTKQQGESGLGLEGQREAVEAYCRQINGRIKASYVEVESGHQGGIKVFPKYDANFNGVIRGLERVSKPSRRVYVSRNDIPQVRNGLGVAILTTPGGVLTRPSGSRQGRGWRSPLLRVVGSEQCLVLETNPLPSRAE